MLARKRDVASCATSHYDVLDAGMKAKAYFEVFVGAKIKAKATLLGFKICDM